MLDTADGYFFDKSSLNLSTSLVIHFMSGLGTMSLRHSATKYKQMHAFMQLGKGAHFSTSAT